MQFNWSLTILMMIICCLPTQATSDPVVQAMAPDALYRRALPSVMTLRVMKNDGSTAMGTAFFALEDGLALTAYHVIQNAASVTARTSTGELFTVDGFIDVDVRRDVALVRVKAFGVPKLSLEPRDPAVGTRVYVIGAPHGLEFSLSDGLVSQIQVLDGRKLLQFTCAASPGNSGGPLINASGQVVGIVASQYRDGQSLNFAVPIAAGLALDKSLPTTPWGIKAATSNPIALPMATTALDSLLRSALLTTLEAGAVWTATMNDVVTKNYGFNRGVPPLLYRHIQTLERTRAAFNATTVEDGSRQPAFQQALSALEASRQALDMMASSIREAQRANSWLGAPQDQLNRAAAILTDTQRFDSTKWAPVLQDSASLTEIPLDLRFIYGLRSDPYSFKIGVSVWPRNPMTIVDVSKNSLADRLGLKPYDEIVSISGTPVATLSEAKQRLLELRGKKGSVTVKRNGALERLWPATIPSKLVP